MHHKSFLAQVKTWTFLLLNVGFSDNLCEINGLTFEFVGFIDFYIFGHSEFY